MAEFINTVDVLGDDATLALILEKNITEYCDNSCTAIFNGTFADCKLLTKVDLPNVTTVGSGVFRGCTTLTSANMPSLTEPGYNGFRESGLVSIKLPSVNKFTTKYCFYACTSLETIDLPSITSIGGDSPFTLCTALTALILRNTTQPCMLNVAFGYSNPIASGTGYIYVPRTLIENYKAATNWSTYAAQFRVLEDYTVDGTVTGELDESKI